MTDAEIAAVVEKARRLVELHDQAVATLGFGLTNDQRTNAEELAKHNPVSFARAILALHERVKVLEFVEKLKP